MFDFDQGFCLVHDLFNIEIKLEYIIEPEILSAGQSVGFFDWIFL
jgi:hypothetical protein